MDREKERKSEVLRAPKAVEESLEKAALPEFAETQEQVHEYSNHVAGLEGPDKTFQAVDKAAVLVLANMALESIVTD